MWCKSIFLHTLMVVAAKPQPQTKDGTRASVTFPAHLYAELERIAEEKKVSVAWVVRDAVEKYVETLYPLFPHEQ